jgi:hypothetical protein
MATPLVPPFPRLNEPFWADTDTPKNWLAVLFLSGRFMKVNPLDTTLTFGERFNVYTRIALYITVIFTLVLLVMRRPLLAIISLLAGTLATGGIVLAHNVLRNEQPIDIVVPPTQDSAYARDMAKNDMESDPYSTYVGNPMPYEKPRKMLRKPTVNGWGEGCFYGNDEMGDNDPYCVQKLYGSISAIDQGLFINPIPDSTLTARSVHWTEDARPSHVSNESALAYRLRV